MHVADQRYWSLILAFRIKTYYPPDTPVPPLTPQLLMGEIYSYASVLFAIEANQYDQLRSTGHYADWLSRLTERVVTYVLTALERLDDGGPGVMLLEYHGLNRPAIERELRDFLLGISHQYEHRQFNASTVANAPLPERQAELEIPSVPPIANRLSSLIHSPSAAEKMSVYMNRKGLNQTEFSIQAGTSDKTIRKFIKTGYIKLSILIGIADAMGVSKDDLLS